MKKIIANVVVCCISLYIGFQIINKVDYQLMKQHRCYCLIFHPIQTIRDEYNALQTY